MIKGLSLFANVGIAETYLKDVGIDIVVANETIEIFVDNISKGQNPTGQYIKYNYYALRYIV